jgi:SAM-dependent methyltransferase
VNKKTEEKLLNIVRRNYEIIAPQYNETRKKHLEPLWSRLVEYANDAPVGAKVMDLGCGNGRLIEAFKGKKIEYLGIDPCEQLIELAREQKPGYDFRVGDMLALDKLETGKFDYIFSTAVIHHLPGQDLKLKALGQTKNKISDNGKIILTAWNMWSDVWQKKHFRQLIFKFWLLGLIGKNKMDFGDILVDWKNSKGEIVSKRYYHAFTMRELRRLAKKTDLKIEKLFKDRFNYYLVLRK